MKYFKYEIHSLISYRMTPADVDIFTKSQTSSLNFKMFLVFKVFFYYYSILTIQTCLRAIF